MLSSEQGIKNGRSSAFCSSSSSSGSSSSSSVLPQTTKRRSIEEVWKDISLSTLHSPTSIQHHPTSPSSPFGGAVLQDFLAGAFGEPRPPPAASTALFDGLPLSSPVPHPLIALSLNSINPSGGDCSCFATAGLDSINRPPAPAELFSYCARKQALDQQLDDSFRKGNGSSADRRKSRMIKNRESAARSRARKQAYTHELELKVAHLLDENTKLKAKYEELRLAMATQLPKKRRLQRTQTAPF